MNIFLFISVCNMFNKLNEGILISETALNTQSVYSSEDTGRHLRSEE